MTKVVTLILATLGLALAAFPVLAAPLSITGQVTYRERMALPPDAALEIQLLDVSRADSRAIVHAAARLSGPGQVPLTFTLNFDDSVINPKHSYALSARLTSGGRLMFLNTTRYAIDPLAPEEPILIVMDFVGTAEPATPPPPPAKTPSEEEAAVPQPITPSAALIGATWRAIEVKGQALPERSRTTLSVAEDGRTGGRGGCNNYFTQATIEGDRISFGSPASKRMACPEPFMQQEAAFFSALTSVASFAVDADTLKLNDAAGKPVIVLVKDKGVRP